MNKKHINIVLIVVVVGLWGTVLYKYVNRFFVTEDLPYTSQNLSMPIIAKIKKDSFTIQPLERDPFLGKLLVKKQNDFRPNVVIKQPIVKKAPEIKITKPFPRVQYYGYIKSQDKSEKLILLKVNNKLERLRLKANIDGLIIEKIYKDSIEVLFNKEKRVFIRN
jgi:hypothetical protein